jgi:hypothetical protein
MLRTEVRIPIDVCFIRDFGSDTAPELVCTLDTGQLIIFFYNCYYEPDSLSSILNYLFESGTYHSEIRIFEL